MSTLQKFQMVAACCVIANFGLNFFQINVTTIEKALKHIGTGDRVENVMVKDPAQ